MVTQTMGRRLRNSIPGHYTVNSDEGGSVIDRERMYRYLIANDLLREDEAREIDETLVEVADRDRVGIEDLRAAGLTVPLRNIGVTSYQWERLSSVEDGHQSMSILDLGDRDRTEFTLDQVPVPVTSSQFQLDRRNVAAGQTRGMGVDTTNVEEHTRAAIRRMEETLTNGNDDIVVGGNSLPGYTNFAARHEVTLSTPWDDLTEANRDEANSDVLEMRRVLRDDGYDGPYGLYIPPNFDGVIDDDYKPEGTRTLRERILAIDGVQFVKVLPSLADDNVVMVQLTRSAVVLAVGQELTTVTWDLMGGLASNWAIIDVSAVALKTAEDEAGNLTSGVAHLS